MSTWADRARVFRQRGLVAMKSAKGVKPPFSRSKHLGETFDQDHVKTFHNHFHFDNFHLCCRCMKLSRLPHPTLSSVWNNHSTKNNLLIAIIHNGRKSSKEWFEGGKVHQVQPVWLFIFGYKQLGETHKNTQWRKAQQMQPVWLLIFECRQLQETYYNTQWREAQ